MRKNCLSQACVLKSFFLSLFLFGISQGVVPTGHAAPSSGYLTLKKAIALGLEKSIRASQLVVEEKRLQLQGDLLQSSKRKHQLSVLLVGARNEIGDDRDLEAQAQEARQLTTSYEENFENGLQWKITNTQRFTSPVEGDGEENTFKKTLLSINYPLYGAAANQTRLNNEKAALALENEWELWEYEKLPLQTQIAHVFLGYVISYEQWKTAEQLFVLTQKNLDYKKSIQTQLTELDIRQFELERIQAHQELMNQKEALVYAQKQLALLIGSAAQQHPQLDHPLVLQQNHKELQQLYLLQSASLQQLKKQIQMKQKDRQLSELASTPNIVLGGSIGQSENDGRDGGNKAIYVSLSYPFGGGEIQKASIEHQALEKLNLQLQEQQEMLKLQAQQDFQQLQSKKNMLEIRQDQYQLAQKKLKLVHESFRVGQSRWDHLFAAEIQVVRSKFSVIQAKVDHWQYYFSILEKTATNALSLLP